MIPKNPTRFIKSSNRLYFVLLLKRRNMLVLWCKAEDYIVQVHKKTLRDSKGVRYFPLK